MLKKSLLIATLVGVAVTGCGKASNQTHAPEKQAESQSNGDPCPIYADLMKRERAADTSYGLHIARNCTRLTQNSEKPNIKLADDAYAEVTSNNQLIWAYYAVYTGEINYNEIAEAISQKYKNANDAFKKQEILAQIKPEIDKNISNAKLNKYYYTDLKPGLSPYDFNTHSFQLGSDVLYGWSYTYSPKLKYLNSNEFMTLKVEDVESAKKIENLRPEGKLRAYVFMFINNVTKKDVPGSSMDELFATITKIEYKDPTGNLIFTQYAN